ncbi:invasion associated locus B family protein [Kushneria aurantia]|uniref:Invasion associated locus B family protein n=1 Tax=Kushneria aurantia TaxID=504092 RepID=A0ABV6G2T2_9GAMM|nr:invasion associated locus B family protein [Kushneria aurantia]
MFIRRALLAALFPLLAAAGTTTALAQAQSQPGAPSQSQAQQQNFDTQQFQSWEVRCPTGGATAQQRCTMNQVVNNPDSNEPLMRVMVGYPPQADGPVMVFLLPLGIRLAPGMQLQVDSNEPTGFPFQVCTPQGCRANLPLDANMQQQLRGGTQATISAIAPDGERLDLNLSLMGFTNASQRIAP